jgi:hypothetical protein
LLRWPEKGPLFLGGGIVGVATAVLILKFVSECSDYQRQQFVI